AFLRDTYDVHIGFGQWMLLRVPVSVGMLLFTWWWVTRGGFKLTGGDSRTMREKEMAEPGPRSNAARMAAAVFGLAAPACIFDPSFARYIVGASVSGLAFAAALILCLIPVDLDTRVFVRDWEAATTVPWGVLLLFGGGLSLGGVKGAWWLGQGTAES